jgi:hypothetical protein
MTTPQRLGLWLVAGNLVFNLLGFVSIVVCNLPAWYCGPYLLYASAALFVGVPLFIATIALAPPGTFAFRQPGSRYRRLFLLNLGLVALIWGVPTVVVLFS